MLDKSDFGEEGKWTQSPTLNQETSKKENNFSPVE